MTTITQLAGTGSERPAVAHTLPEYLPRAGTFIHSVLRFQRRFQPVVIARRTANEGEFPLDAPIYALPENPLRLGRIAARANALAHRYPEEYEFSIERHARWHRCVAMHAHHGWSGRATIRAALRLDIPLVTTFYGRDLALKKSRKALRPPYQRLFAEGARFVCEGPAMARHLEQLGCPADRIRIVKIGIDVSKFEFASTHRTGPLIVLQTARHVEKKGIDLSIRSFAAAKSRLGEAELWILGDGELRGELERLSGQLGMNGSVKFLGERSYAEYREIATQVHVCIQPSRTAADGDTEGGAPTVLLEMQARGVPIVATRHADIPSVVASSEGLVDEEDVDGLADALVEIAGLSEAELAVRAARGRRYVEAEHDAVHMAAGIEGIYDELLDPSRAGAQSRTEAAYA